MTESATTTDPRLTSSSWLCRLKIAWTVFFAVLSVALCVLWLRSYWYIDAIIFDSPWAKAFGGASVVGEIEIGMTPLSPNNFVKFDSHGVIDRSEERAFMHEYSSTICGFGVSHGTPETFILIPHWFAILLVSGIAIGIWKRPYWRFSLRTMLIVTTLVAVGFGLAVYVSSG